MKLLTCLAIIALIQGVGTESSQAQPAGAATTSSSRTPLLHIPALAPALLGIKAEASVDEAGTLVVTLRNSSNKILLLRDVTIDAPGHPRCSGALPPKDVPIGEAAEWRRLACIGNIPANRRLSMVLMTGARLTTLSIMRSAPPPAPSQEVLSPDTMLPSEVTNAGGRLTVTLSATLELPGANQHLEEVWLPKTDGVDGAR